MSMNSYVIREEVNLQVIIWMIAAAIYRTAKAVQRFTRFIATLIPALLAVLQVAGMTLGATAVIVAAVVGAAMYPALVLCVAAIVAYGVATK